MEVVDGFTEEQVRWILEEWVPALRSGKYQQSRGALQDAHGYCCLGIACELIGVEWQKRGSSPGDLTTEMKALFDGESAVGILPRGLAKKIGIGEYGKFTPKYRIGDGYDGYSYNRYEMLVELNDDAGWNLDQIADFIEHELMNPDSEYSFVVDQPAYV